MKTLFKINVFTYIFLILSMLSGYFREIFIVYIILVLHELGHFFLMKIMGVDVKSITIYPYGGMINSNMLINTNSIKVILISFGGVLVQLFLYIVVYFIYMSGLIDIYYYEIFFKCNSYIIMFNLLPIYPLDGFKVLNSFLELFLNFRRSLIFSFIVSIICLLFFIIYLYVYKISNYVIVVFLVLNLYKYIKDLKFLMHKFYLERIMYDINYNGLVSTNCIENMYKNKFNYINCVDEVSFLTNVYKYW